MSGSRKQDPEVKGNPYSARFLSATDEADNYRVRSAQVGVTRFYRVALERGYPQDDRCNCDAPGRCWHIDAAHLRQQIERVEANAGRRYQDMTLPELQAEEIFLRAALAEADQWLTRAQYGVLGDEVLDRLLGAEQAA